MRVRGPSPSEPRLRRAQALAPSNELGVELTRELLGAKLARRAEVLDRLPAPGAASRVRQQAEQLTQARTLTVLRLIESRAGLAYWDAWKSLPVRWNRLDAGKVPEHWKTAGHRISPLTGSPRLAATPVHAVLNLLYALLEAEATIACWAVGLDPGLGVLHADQPARASMALDLMEPVRPAVDAFVLDLLRERTWSTRDFQEVERGQVRVLLPLARALLRTSPRWAGEVAPWAERVAQALLKATGSNRRLPTPLTQANRSAGRQEVRKRLPKQPRLPGLQHGVCGRCGAVLQRPGRKICSACEYVDRTERVVVAGPARLAQLRQAGTDPAHGGRAAQLRAEKVRTLAMERKQWDATGAPADPEVFRREILPGLQSLTVSQIARAAGISLRYASLIRSGQKVPHPRLWQVLQRLAEPVERNP
ncbi:MAG: CRISPR-associated endonuclease Cas1 [Armatimonadota bacterium]|nr:CRISPR-associated endonuclease Cas1 [Armatimonadota bacterium]